ncbi:hypothetical protein CEXT_627911 [Caerostris extrusa]|uniref:Uncharacterized protein n=1 Tax=Caerostris extrusa TaxID=172846 RepID=A0AAV4NCD8_CAEEX|nr:hypothetical protein CEXT_627911 [Caerostris extrusa]
MDAKNSKCLKSLTFNVNWLHKNAPNVPGKHSGPNTTTTALSFTMVQQISLTSALNRFAEITRHFIVKMVFRCQPSWENILDGD